MTAQPRVLVVTGAIGAGHNQAAAAVAESLRRTGSVEVDTLEILSTAPWSFRTYYAGGYSFSVTRAPHLYSLGYWCSDREDSPERSMFERIRLWNEWRHLGEFRRRIAEAKADLIVHTHFLAPPTVARMIDRGDVAVRQMVVTTDCELHRYWHSERVEQGFVASEPAAARLGRWGVQADRITQSGIPVHPKWTEEIDRTATRAEWNLPADRPIVLLSGGTEFTLGPIAKIARRIVARSEEAFVVVLAGRNKKLLGQLTQAPEFGRSIMGVPFTDRIHQLVDVADVMVTKAGGLSTSECLAVGAPMVLLKPVMGQEARNARRLTEAGAAITARNSRQVVDAVGRLLDDRAELATMADAARALHRPATAIVTDAVLAAL